MKKDKNHACYIDQLASTKPGHKISIDIIRAIKNSKGFVLIGSDGAQQSKEEDPIPQEMDIFTKQNSNKFIFH